MAFELVTAVFVNMVFSDRDDILMIQDLVTWRDIKQWS